MSAECLRLDIIYESVGPGAIVSARLCDSSRARDYAGIVNRGRVGDREVQRPFIVRARRQRRVVRLRRRATALSVGEQNLTRRTPASTAMAFFP